MARTLMVQLTRRFGTLDPTVAARLTMANPARPDIRAANFVEAPTLDAVFRD